MYPFRADPSERIALKVVGLVEPIDPREEYWMAVPFYFTVHELEERVLVPIYITEESFFKGLGTRYPTLVGDLVWFYYLDSGILTPGTVDKTLEDMEGLKTDINKRFPRSLVLSGLPLTLEEYKDKLTLARASLFLFISLVVLAILYFLAVIMGTVARSWSDEISLLRSRGASVPHVGMLLILGEGPLIIASVAVGPFLALAVVAVPAHSHHRPGWWWLLVCRPLGGHVCRGCRWWSPVPSCARSCGGGPGAFGDRGVPQNER